MKLPLFLFAAILLTGCISKSYEYRPEEDAPTATIRLGDGKPAFLYLSNQASCPKTSMSRDGSATTIPANTRLWVEAGDASLGLGYGRKCSVPLSFVAQPNKDYYIHFQDSGNGCAATIVSRDEGGQFSKEPSTRREKAERCFP